MKRASVTLILLSLCWPHSAAAQSSPEPGVQLGVHAVAVVSDEFDDTDTGVSVRLSWNPVALVGAEAEVAHDAARRPERPGHQISRSGA